MKNTKTTKPVKKGGASETTLNELLMTKLSVLHDVEKKLIKALPKMAKNSTDPELKAGFEKHLKETEGHLARLDKVFSILDAKPKKITSAAMDGLIEDAEWVIKNVKGSAALDANLIAAAGYVEHYEMAGYVSACEWADLLGYGDIADLLEETLDEEINADEKMQDLANAKINDRVKVEGNEDDK